jgi:hypothetical protein
MNGTYSRPRWWVGFKSDGSREAFRTATEPTQDSHGERYFATWGPFRTKRGARVGSSWRAVNNPHMVTVADVERIAKREGL